MSYGVTRTFDDFPQSVLGFNILLDEPITIADKEPKRLQLFVYNFDPSLAPKSKTVMKFMIDTEWEYWDELYKDPEHYKAEKERIANELLAILDKRFPGLSEQVEMIDVATPMTWVRYTGNWKGSYQGWLEMSPATFGMHIDGLKIMIKIINKEAPRNDLQASSGRSG